MRNRRCSACKETKPPSAYYTGQTRCKSCQNNKLPDSHIMDQIKSANELMQGWNRWTSNKSY